MFKLFHILLCYVFVGAQCLSFQSVFSRHFFWIVPFVWGFFAIVPFVSGGSNHCNVKSQGLSCIASPDFLHSGGQQEKLQHGCIFWVWKINTAKEGPGEICLKVNPKICYFAIYSVLFQIGFVVIYALLCGEKLSQKLWPWRKKLQIWGQSKFCEGSRSHQEVVDQEASEGDFCDGRTRRKWVFL